MRLGHASEKSLQDLAKQDLLQGGKTYKVEFHKHCVISEKIKVKFNIATHCIEGILDYAHTYI